MWRKMTNTSWIEKKTNERLLRKVEDERHLLKSITARKINLIGHIIQHNGQPTRHCTAGNFLKNYITIHFTRRLH